VGHIQRAVVIYWAIKEYERTGGIGLEPGCGQAISPFCVGTDYFAGAVHPVYGGSYQPQVRCMGEVLPFKNEVFDFIVSHHSLEHMKDTEKTLREWLRVLKLGGKIAIVMPDKRCPYYKDPSHVSECTPQEFLAVLQRLENIQIIEFNSLKNHFSFNAVIEKSSNKGDIMENIMEKVSTEEVKLREQLRTLWQDRVMWTRMMLISGDGEVNNIYQRLHKNQEDIGDALKPFLEKYLFCWDDIPGKDEGIFIQYLFRNYSINWILPMENVTVEKDETGNAIKFSFDTHFLVIRLNTDRTKAVFELNINGRNYEFKFNAKAENGKLNIYQDNVESRNVLVTMLKNSITMSKNLIISEKANDIGSSQETMGTLRDTARSIAGFLSGLNSRWTHNNLETVLVNQISSFKDEIVAHLNKNNQADTQAYNKTMEQASNFADVLIDGIVKVKQSS
jgi:predicted SAM-dependent methyltransferase